MDEIVKNKPIKKMIKNIAIKRIRTKLDIKINENKWLGVELKKKKKQINEANDSKQNKLKKIQMIRDEIKNKIQLETINVNKTIENKRRWIESKEKIN
jgi:hypothetical protein